MLELSDFHGRNLIPMGQTQKAVFLLPTVEFGAYFLSLSRGLRPQNKGLL
jgi:hypothetical protein